MIPVRELVGFQSSRDAVPGVRGHRRHGRPTPGEAGARLVYPDTECIIMINLSIIHYK